MKRIKESAILLLGLGFVVFICYFSGIGCPIKWVTGISCAGCGLTRACLEASQLHFETAFSYHPLFWMIPFVPVLYFIRDKLPPFIEKGILWTYIILFLFVYIVRLVDSSDAVVVVEPGNGLIARIIHILFI